MASALPPTPSRHNTSPLSGGTIVAGLTGGLAIVTITGLIAAPLAGFSSISADTRLWIAYGVLVTVALLTGFVVTIWKAPAGFVPALLAGLSGALFLWLMRMLLLEGGPYNRLVFGPIGLVTVLVAATTGGWIAYLLDSDRFHARVAPSDAARVGLWVASLWVSFELVGRMVGGAGVGPAIDNALAGEILGVLVSMVAAAWVIARYGQANGVSTRDWDYRWSVKTIAIGVAAGLLALGLMSVTAMVDQALWTMPEDVLAVFTEGLQAGVWVAILLLVANPLAAPICEEIAWRGVVQSAFVRAWGPWVGIGVTVILFAMKHVVVDASFARLTTLLMLALVFGLVRHRWGTGSSTVVHLVVNLYSTGYLVAST